MNLLPLQGITSLAEAELLIENALRDRRQKLHTAEGLDMSNESSEERAARIQAELAVAQAEYTACLATLEVLPEGPTKEEELTKKAGLDFKLRKLNAAVNTTGIIYVMEKARNIAMLHGEITAIDDYVTQLTARKAQLTA